MTAFESCKIPLHEQSDKLFHEKCLPAKIITFTELFKYIFIIIESQLFWPQKIIQNTTHLCAVATTVKLFIFVGLKFRGFEFKNEFVDI